MYSLFAQDKTHWNMRLVVEATSGSADSAVRLQIETTRFRVALFYGNSCCFCVQKKQKASWLWYRQKLQRMYVICSCPRHGYWRTSLCEQGCVLSWSWVFASCCVCDIQVMDFFIPSTQYHSHRLIVLLNTTYTATCFGRTTIFKQKYIIS
jgi:hypothetical protein